MQSPSAALYVFVLYLAIQSVESYLITPLIQQREVSLPLVLTLTSQLFFASLFGFLGLLLATPLTACGLVLVKMLYIEDVLGDSTGYSKRRRQQQLILGETAYRYRGMHHAATGRTEAIKKLYHLSVFQGKDL